MRGFNLQAHKITMLTTNKFQKMEKFEIAVKINILNHFKFKMNSPQCYKMLLISDCDIQFQIFLKNNQILKGKN